MAAKRAGVQGITLGRAAKFLSSKSETSGIDKMDQARLTLDES